MTNGQFTPRYKLIISYNIVGETNDVYFQFVTQEFVPRLQGMGIHLFRVYNTEWGDYPMRQVEFLSEQLETIREAMSSTTWQRLVTRLENFVTDFSTKVIVFRHGFQL
ncbi:MAG TPA: hypothetical protein PLD47_16420 [Aggregatilineales bacterium]|nr:hypothetical protein [Anaerolineales bacterium]HRE49313.1 hypothetical protein [Aggregatilineales bacterium]